MSVASVKKATYPVEGMNYNAYRKVRERPEFEIWIQQHEEDQDFNKTARTIAELLAGIPVQVTTTGFANDLTTFRGRDDVLTLMIHLGYLAYDEREQMAYIPNEEIRLEFTRTLHQGEPPQEIRPITV